MGLAARKLRMTAPGGVTNITDSFDRADNALSLGSTDTGEAWTAHSGTWGISSNLAYCSAVGGGDEVATVDFGAANQIVQATLTTRDADTGLVARVTDGNNFYLALFTSTSNAIRIFKKVAGSYTALTAGTPNQVYNGDVVAFEVNGTSLVLKVNGVTQDSVADSSITTGGRAGLRSGSTTARWNAFSISAI